MKPAPFQYHAPKTVEEAVALLAFGLAEGIEGSGFIAAFVGGAVFGGMRRGRGGDISYLIEQSGAVLAAVTFVVFGAVLLVTAIKVGRDAFSDKEHTVDVGSLRSVRLLRRFWPVTESYDGTRMTVRANGRRALTPLALVVVAILGTDVVFAIDSVPAVYGITGDPYLVFATNAFALLGLRPASP